MHPVVRDAVMDRRAVLRGLGWGAAGVALGGSGLLAACGGDGNAGPGTTAPRRPKEGLPPYDPDAPYWEQGNFARIAEESTVTDLRVTGTIPSSLSGLYVRNGSNAPTGTSPHWFMGDGMVHSLRIEQGKATWYRNRYVQTTLHEEGRTFAEAGVPGGDITQSNVALVHHHGRLLTLGEVGFPYELATKDLSTIGPYDFLGELKTWMTAHPKIDPANGQMHFFGYGFADPLLTYHLADTDGTLLGSQPVDIPAATMIHDFAITETDVIFWLGPVLFGRDGSVPGFPYYWDPQAGPSKVGVMRLSGIAADIKWVDIDPCFVFHGTNAYRDGDEVVLHVNKLDSAFGPDGDLVPSRLHEWRINTDEDVLTFREEQLNDVDMDLPSIDRRYTGRPYGHAWYTTTDEDGPWGFEFAGTLHRDTRTGREQRWEPGELERAGEPFFVADGKGEGEGWLLLFAYDRTTDTSHLAILDAQDVAAGPVARIHLPVRVPYGFHGLWVPESDV